MNLLLVAGLALGSPSEAQEPVPQDVETCLYPSDWVLEWGKHDGDWFDQGRLELRPGGWGELTFGNQGGRVGAEIRYSANRIGHSKLAKFTPGAFKLDGDRLTVCLVVAGKPVPTDCDVKPNDGRFLLVFKRKRDR